MGKHSRRRVSALQTPGSEWGLGPLGPLGLRVLGFRDLGVRGLGFKV